MSIKIAKTPEGIVVRFISASGERAYRKNFDGSWVTANHKGPWVVINDIYVPGDALKVVHEMVKSGEIEMVRT